MAIDLGALIGQVGKEKGIQKDVLVQALESAVLSAARKHFGHNRNLETQFNEETGLIEVLEFKVVVDSVEDEDTQISLEDARKNFDSEALVGDEIGRKLDTSVLGRIAALTAKQVILQKVREAERQVIFDEYKGSKGELVNGIFQRYDRGSVIVNLGRTEAVIPKREQIQKERYRQGDRIRALILDIDPTARGPQIILTRSHPDFLRKLFALEVPEISEGSIEVKAIAREPGERAKIAVYSSDPNVDPVGACVGIKGSRVQSVVQELRGERIDIITWTPDEPSFVARALAPAEITRVVLDEEEHSMEVIVADDQLSLAIGRRGQNVKLASKLSGWKIDVRSVSTAEEEAKLARQSLETIPGIDFTQAELLFQEGFRNAKEVADANLEELKEVEGLSAEQAEVIWNSAKEHLASVGDEAIQSSGDNSEVSELNRLMLGSEVEDALIAAGYRKIQRVVEASDDELLGIEGVTEEALEKIRFAVEVFLKGTPQIR